MLNSTLNFPSTRCNYTLLQQILKNFHVQADPQPTIIFLLECHVHSREALSQYKIIDDFKQTLQRIKLNGKKRNDLSYTRGVTRGERGSQFPGSRITAGAPKSTNNVTSTFFNTVNFLPKKLKF